MRSTDDLATCQRSAISLGATRNDFVSDADSERDIAGLPFYALIVIVQHQCIGLTDLDALRQHQGEGGLFNSAVHFCLLIGETCSRQTKSLSISCVYRGWLSSAFSWSHKE
jgi:hypothetical protein